MDFDKKRRFESVYSNTTKVMIDTDGAGNMIYLPLDKIIEIITKQKASN